MTIAVVAVCILLGALCVFAIAHAYGRRHDAERERLLWQRVADNQNLELHAEKRSYRLKGTIGPISFQVDTDTCLTYGYDAMLGLRVTLPRPASGHLVVWYATDPETAKSVWPTLAEIEGKNDWFAQKYRVYTDDPLLPDAFLSAEVKEKLNAVPGSALILDPDEAVVLFGHLDPPSIKAAAQVVAALRDAQILAGR